MIESPLLQELLAERIQVYLLRFLKARFGSIPGELEAELRAITQVNRLEDLIPFAGECPDLAAFQAKLVP